MDVEQSSATGQDIGRAIERAKVGVDVRCRGAVQIEVRLLSGHPGKLLGVHRGVARQLTLSLGRSSRWMPMYTGPAFLRLSTLSGLDRLRGPRGSRYTRAPLNTRPRLKTTLNARCMWKFSGSSDQRLSVSETPTNGIAGY